ncbi:hypothetical protein TSUD_389180 [Trifolium subterraneum]|uniref:MalT-like TPR region domain-containing protein n=1 Tax=Trifolium subterraneum TaxID=3900 RepID=A0A2Z6NTK9_TRISU|nr:hypothetical protein TSUD_389180 [Trifolium subterraneum]
MMRKHRRLGLNDSIVDELDNPDLGPFLLKITRDMLSSEENLNKTLDLALRAWKSFEISTADGKPSLELVICLHVLATIYCNLGQYNEAISILERSIDVPVLEDGLEIQGLVLGETGPRFRETCQYVAESHFQALQFDEARKLCQMALDIHKGNGLPASFEEAATRRLMGLICDSKGDYESALEHYVLAENRQELDVASVDCSIGDAYLSLARYDEAIFSYQKALTVFKSTKGENHPTVASVFVRYAINEAADLFKEARTILEKEYGPYHSDTLGVYSNLAGTYDKWEEWIDDAIEMFEYVVGTREEKLGTANHNVDDEKRRLAELLKEAGRARNRKSKRSLETLLDSKRRWH